MTQSELYTILKVAVHINRDVTVNHI